MPLWKVTPIWKKSVIETQSWIKAGVNGYISHEIGWRHGEFFIESDEEPEIDDYTNLLELTDNWSTEDGNWEDTDYDISEDHQEKARQIIEEGSVYDLEEDGWTMDECEITIQGGVKIERVE